jgi:hypothetical protein
MLYGILNKICHLIKWPKLEQNVLTFFRWNSSKVWYKMEQFTVFQLVKISFTVAFITIVMAETFLHFLA